MMIFVEDCLDFNEDEAQAEYESGFPSLDDFLEDEKPEPPVIFRAGSICPSCEGDGLFKRPTTYTVDGRPICFRCIAQCKKMFNGSYYYQKEKEV